MDAALFPACAHAEPATTSLPRSKNGSAGFIRERLFSAARSVTRPEVPPRGAHFAIRSGQFEILDQPALADRSIIYSLFIEAARTGTPLSRDTERIINYVVCHSELPAMNQVMSWETLKEILAADYPGMALRPMHRLGLLMEILPEMRAIDSLVVRDFYHRYTVDEHSLRTIEHLQALAEPPDARGMQLRSDLENAGAARSFDFRFATSRHRQRHAGGKSRSRQFDGAGKRRFATGTDARGRSGSAVSD